MVRKSLFHKLHSADLIFFNCSKLQTQKHAYKHRNTRIITIIVTEAYVHQVYEELVSVRQTVTQEQEQKVQAEIDLLKQKTGTEIEHLRLTAQKVRKYDSSLIRYDLLELTSKV